MQDKVGFLVPVPHRDANTLLPLIRQYILPRTTVMSDMWGAYNMGGMLGYHHFTVNHTHNFVDPNTGAMTQHVESMWQKAKQAHKARYGTDRDLLPTYLNEFMWRQRFGASPFRHIVEHITQVYPLP